MKPDRIPMARPSIDESDVDAVRRVLESGRLSQGPALEAFETEFASSLCQNPGVGVNSGTAGLMLAMDALGVRPGDEVITPSLTFSATANAIVRLGAKPIFVDVSPVDLNVDPDSFAVAISSKTRAIVVVHLFGRVANMERISSIARKGGIAVIEDACEALGAGSADGLAGTFGDAAVFSFYANKPITSGEGGMIVSGDANLLAQCRLLRNQGRDADGRYGEDSPGFSCRLSELHAALGNSQLRRLPELSAEREAVARNYDDQLRDHENLELPPLSIPPVRHAWFTYPLRLADELAAHRDDIRAMLAEDGIETGDYFPAVHRLPYYKEHYATAAERLPVTDRESARLLALPLYAGLTPEQVDTVTSSLCDALTAVCGHNRT